MADQPQATLVATILGWAFGASGGILIHAPSGDLPPGLLPSAEPPASPPIPTAGPRGSQVVIH